MFENVFTAQLAKYTSDQHLLDTLWKELEKHYSKSGRHYHTLAHLDNLVSELYTVKEEIADWQTVVFSIAYHDIIYNTLRQDNEERSARIADNRLSLLSVTVTQRQKCFSQIIATKTHQLDEDSDTNYFIDADLAILGHAPETYHEYTQLIRKEFWIYPDRIYKPGRQKVLRRFLNMTHIYKTETFRRKYEQQARHNLRSELEKMAG